MKEEINYKGAYENVMVAFEMQKKEIERLNNIINKLEKWLKEYIDLFKEPDIYEEQTLEDLKVVLDKLQELKGSDKE